MGLVPLALWGASLLVLPRARTSLACSLLPAQLPNFAEPPFSPPNRPRAQTARLSQVGARPKRACTLTVTVGCRHSPLRCASCVWCHDRGAKDLDRDFRSSARRGRRDEAQVPATWRGGCRGRRCAPLSLLAARPPHATSGTTTKTAPTRAAITKAGKIPRKRKQDGSGHGGDCGCDDEGQKDNVLLWVYPNLKNTRLFVGYDGRGVRLGSALLPQELENIRATGTKANNVVVSTGALQGEQQWERYVKPFTSQVDDGTMTQEAACRRRRHMKKAEPLAWHTTQSTASPHHSWFTAAHVLFVTTSHRAPHAFVSLSTHAMSTHTPLRLPDRGWLAWHRLQLRHLDGPAHSIMSLLSVCLDD